MWVYWFGETVLETEASRWMLSMFTLRDAECLFAGPVKVQNATTVISCHSEGSIIGHRESVAKKLSPRLELDWRHKPEALGLLHFKSSNTG